VSTASEKFPLQDQPLLIERGSGPGDLGRPQGQERHEEEVIGILGWGKVAQVGAAAHALSLRPIARMASAVVVRPG